MSTNGTEVTVGALFLAGVAGFMIYASQLTGGVGPGGGSNQYWASFRSAEGISVGTDVRMSGVKVGSVTSLTLNPGNFRADTHFSVSDEIELPDDTAVVVASEGLLGGSFVELLPGGSPFNLDPGAEIVDTQGAVSIVQLLLRFVTGGEE